MAISSYTVTRHVLVPMRDGTRLAADVWLPAAGEPVPRRALPHPVRAKRL